MVKYPIHSPIIDELEISSVTDAVKSGWISSQGGNVKKFESSLLEFICPSSKHHTAVSVTNGTHALELGLRTLGLPPDSEVIVPNLTFGASVNSIIAVGARPKFVDVDPLTWMPDIKLIDDAISAKTSAIMVVHLYGKHNALSDYYDSWRQKGIRIIEDCAEAFGSYFENSFVGVDADVAAFSFFANKTITTGEGGLLLVNQRHANAELATTIRDHGMSKDTRYWHVEIGSNYRMTNLQAAIGLSQLKKATHIITRKKQLNDQYRRLLKDICIFQDNAPLTNNCTWLNAIKFKDNLDLDKLSKYLQTYGIETRRIFSPMSNQPAFLNFTDDRQFQNSQEIYQSGICLPSSPWMTEEHVEEIAFRLHEICLM